jgi:hypothetical protein
MTHTTPSQLRAQAEVDLKTLGQKRIKVLAQLEEIDKQLKPKIARAVEMEVPYRRITELTAVASNTARAWARAGGGSGE